MVRRFLPSPFSIALILTLFSFLLAFAIEVHGGGSISLAKTFGWWSDGLWNAPMLVFAMQMMLMLVLGHSLALTSVVDSIIQRLVSHCHSTSQAAVIVSLSALVVGLFNWGLGLIFGAIFARKVGESLSAKKIPLNYALIGAAGYSALLIWHAGISGSAPIKVAEQGNLQLLMSGVLTSESLSLLPERIELMDTVFSSSNMITCVVILICIPLTLYLLGRTSKKHEIIQLSVFDVLVESKDTKPVGAERIDKSKWVTRITGSIILAYCFYKMILGGTSILDFFTPNNINLILFGASLWLHASFESFTKSIETAISGASGILIQFPIYFGIMGLIKESGMVTLISDQFVLLSNDTTFPIFSFLSAGLVNIFIPSGGGQWVIQGPILIKAAIELNIPFGKTVMALAYGDQITNMLQPFWALPLLGITKLSAKDILPYTLIMFFVGFIIYFASLLLLF
jgi:short-chain fatty acids transporter